MALVEVGTPAPHFSLRCQKRDEHRLSDYLGQPIVLLFYPLDFSSVCSNEMDCTMEILPRLKTLDAQVFGISVDSVFCHAAFAEQRGIDFPLLADFHPKGEVAEQYGFYLPERGHNSRGYVVIAPDGTVAAVRDVGAPNMPDFEEIVAAVEAAK